MNQALKKIARAIRLEIVRKQGRLNSRWHHADRASPVPRYQASDGAILKLAHEPAGFRNGAKVFVRPMNKDVLAIAARIRYPMLRKVV